MLTSLSRDPEGCPILPSFIKLHPGSLALYVIAFDLITEEFFCCFLIPRRPLHMHFFVFVLGRLVSFRPVCLWDHPMFIRLQRKLSTTWCLNETHAMENSCFFMHMTICRSFRDGGSNHMTTHIKLWACEWGLLVWVVWSRLQLSTCELIHVLLMGQSGPCSITAVTVWVCMCFFCCWI